MSDGDNQESGLKILGIPTEKISKLSYMLILASTGFALLLAFMGILGMGLPGSAFFGAIGLFSVFLSLVGLFVFEERFSEVDKSHFKFIALAYVTFFAAAMIVGSILKLLGSFGFLIVFIFSIVQFMVFYAGYGLYGEDKPADKDNLSDKYEQYKNMLFSKFKKAEEKAAETVKETVNKVEEKVDAVTEPENDSDKNNTSKNDKVDTSA